MLKVFIIAVVLIGAWYLLLVPNISFTGVPWHIQGNCFTVQWDVPEGTVSYRGHWSIDSLSLISQPFLCRQFKIPPPKKFYVTQKHTIRYKVESFDYDLYYRVFAFDINGKCTEVKTSFCDVSRKNLDLFNKEGS